MAYSYEIAAILAALFWAVSSIYASEASKYLGAMAFTRLRMTQVFFMLLLISYINGGWQNLSISSFWILIVSGIIGIFVGDVALFSAMRRIGPRRTGVMFATNGVMSILLGYVFLNEVISLMSLLGCFLVITGVIVVIIMKSNISHSIDATQGSLAAAIVFGLVAALGQAVGAIIAKPVLINEGIEPFTASLIRVSGSLICLYIMLLLPFKSAKSRMPLTIGIFSKVLVSGFLAMTLGMSLVLYGLSGGKTGVIMTLSSMTPVMILPIIWLQTKIMPNIYAWIGAMIAVVGSSIIFLY